MSFLQKLKIFLSGVKNVFKISFAPTQKISLIEILNKAGVQDVDACMLWAFGEKWQSTPFKDLPYEWNIRHKDIFEMTGNMRITDSLLRIGQEYLNGQSKIAS